VEHEHEIDEIFPEQNHPKHIRDLSPSDLEELARHDKDFPHISPLITLLFFKKILIIIGLIILYLAFRGV